MYTSVSWVEQCGLAAVGLCALLLVACGDDSGGPPKLEGTPCTLGGTEPQTANNDCPKLADGTPRPTMCSMAGGVPMQVCHAPGTQPTLPATTPTATAATQGVWSECCCAMNNGLFCQRAEAGSNAIMNPVMQQAVCGNGVIEAGEVCDGTNLNGATCPAGMSGIAMCAAGCQALDMSMCMGPGAPVAGNAP